MTTKPNPNVDSFQEDVLLNGGYQYTTNAPLSAQLANARLTQATLDIGIFEGKSLIDIGCGDGTYSFELVGKGKALDIVGIDPATEAICIANQRAGNKNATFKAASAYDLPFPDQHFDYAILRGVLHHLEFPQKAIEESLRVAKEIIVIEPNGFNPVLKLIEKFSSYHRAHDEKSYTAWKLFDWVRKNSGTIEKVTFAGLVPFFSPPWMARICKIFEPLVERLPIVRRICCAVCVFRAKSSHQKTTEKKEAA